MTSLARVPARLLSLAVILLLAALAVPAAAQEFPKLSGRVVDAAGLLSAGQVAQIDQLSAQVEQASSRQLVVATIPDLQGYPIEDYGYRLGRAWKIGQAEANNGVILLVAPKERKVRIEVGYGLEPIMTDALLSVIVNGTILPRFRAGDMAGGIVAGTQAIAEQLKLPLEAAEKRAQAAAEKRAQAATAQRATRGGNSTGDWITAIFWVVVIVFVILPLLFGGARGRRFRGGGAPVVMWGPGWGSSGGGGSSWGGGGGGWGGGGSGFSGSGGSFGGGGASGGW